MSKIICIPCITMSRHFSQVPRTVVGGLICMMQVQRNVLTMTTSKECQVLASFFPRLSDNEDPREKGRDSSDKHLDCSMDPSVFACPGDGGTAQGRVNTGLSRQTNKQALRLSHT